MHIAYRVYDARFGRLVEYLTVCFVLTVYFSGILGNELLRTESVMYRAGQSEPVCITQSAVCRIKVLTDHIRILGAAGLGNKGVVIRLEQVDGIVVCHRETSSESKYRDTVGVGAYDLVPAQYLVLVRSSFYGSRLIGYGRVKYLRGIGRC